MDEAEKYQQRLQAIAEKRRLQEEEERARRALEDEKLRVQQLKRKSLRDQWLMEGPPTSPDSAGPRSPLWGPHAQHMEANIHKLQSEMDQLGEEVERIQEHIENSSDSAEGHTDHHSNREGDTSETAGQSVEVRGVTNISEKSFVPPSLTNGTTGEQNLHTAPLLDRLAHANGLAEGAITLTFLGFSEAEPGQGVCDDDSAIIRAERVIITDEGDEVQDVFKAVAPVEDAESSNDEEEETRVAENHLETCGADPTGEVIHTEGEDNDTQANADTDTDAKAEDNAETSSRKSSNNSDVNADVSADACPDASAEVTTPALVESTADGNVEHTVLEGPEPHTGTIEVAIEAVKATSSIPELSGTVQLEDHQEIIHSVTLSSNSTTAPAPCSPSQFQDIPLDGTVEVAGSSRKQLTQGHLVEEQPLLASKAAPLTDTAAANRAEGADHPKTNTCQCCTVM